MRCVGGLLVYAMIFFCVFTGLYPNPFTAYRSLIKDCAQVQPKNLTLRSFSQRMRAVAAKKSDLSASTQRNHYG